MMKPALRFGCVLCALCACAALAGCKLAGYVTDQSNIETYVKDITLCGDKYITIVSGGAVRSVPLAAVSRIVMANEESRTINGQLYLCASIEFGDGSKLDAKNKSNASLTFVSVASSLCGDSQKGRYTISFANVSKVIIKGE